MFTSPLVRGRLAALGLPRAEIESLAQPIWAMELRSTRGATCTLEYPNEHACGFDRVRLDARLLELAAAAGARVMRGRVVRDVRLGAAASSLAYSDLAITDRSDATLSARVVVGADGPGSRVARAATVTTERNLLRRSALTFHMAADKSARAGDAKVGRFVLGEHWYVGYAPVPGDRVNVGIVVPTKRLAEGVDTVIDESVGSVVRIDDAQVAGRLEHHVTRVGGNGWLLVGDAAGFIDPLTGEGLQRALIGADLAAEAIHRSLSGDRDALAVYDRRVRSRFRSKNVFSLVLQAFAANPHVLDYALHRLGSRPQLRATLTAVLADQRRATDALDPRFIASLLAP